MREGARAQLYSMTHNSSLLFSSFSHGAIGPMEQQQQQQRVFQHRQADIDTDSSAPFQEPLCHMGRARRQTGRHTVCFCQSDSVQSLAVRASLPEDSSFFFASLSPKKSQRQSVGVWSSVLSRHITVPVHSSSESFFSRVSALCTLSLSLFHFLLLPFIGVLAWHSVEALPSPPPPPPPPLPADTLCACCCCCAAAEVLKC